MTTATRGGLPERVRQIVAEHISRLQFGYLADDAYAVGVLARLRRGAGKEPHLVPELLGLVDTSLLYEAPPTSCQPPCEEDLFRAADAVHAALTLWALHQQSVGTGMHQSDCHDAPAGLGAAVRRLMPFDIDNTVLKRLVRAGTAPHPIALAQRLREIVLLLRREEIPLDYVLLAEQLYRWQQPGGRDVVRRAWGRSFHAFRHPKWVTRDGAAGSPTVSTDSELVLKDAL
ncbi:type I-E CRISPR-associated protein Cse2/CasB [Streptomyces sp. NPDC093982]|uniref:type I-E CRISPR-associated protein Cse2/CasB n=1 Tax=Streptomyces sp. NPDC093982 TaxID=3155077 RepID=UPI00344330DD